MKEKCFLLTGWTWKTPLAFPSLSSALRVQTVSAGHSYCNSRHPFLFSSFLHHNGCLVSRHKCFACRRDVMQLWRKKKEKRKAAGSFAKWGESIANGDLDSGTKHVLCHSSDSQMTSHSVPMWQKEARRRLSRVIELGLKRTFHTDLEIRPEVDFFCQQVPTCPISTRVLFLLASVWHQCPFIHSLQKKKENQSGRNIPCISTSQGISWISYVLLFFNLARQCETKRVQKTQVQNITVKTIIQLKSIIFQVFHIVNCFSSCDMGIKYIKLNWTCVEVTHLSHYLFVSWATLQSAAVKFVCFHIFWLICWFSNHFSLSIQISGLCNATCQHWSN